jgi:hypothetical protein
MKLEDLTPRGTGSGPTAKAGLLVLAALVAATMSGCATAPVAGARGAAAEHAVAGDECGIRVEALRLSAAGYVLDFRYRVVDASKAAPLLDGKQRPYLLDGKGAKLGVPRTPKLGSLRQTSRNGKVKLDHSYFILFANPAKYLQRGDRVTLVVGDAKVPGLTVE